jgi:N-acyl-D-amino-acid deacylase
MSFDLVLANGRVVDGTGLPWFAADVGITGDRIAAVGRLDRAEARERIDVAGKVVSPGFIDAHVHGDLALLVDPYHEPAVRQGVTTYVVGQDGVAFAPAAPATKEYMRRYTAGFNGGHEVDTGDGTVAGYLARFDGRCAINACTLIPNGNIRMDAMGLETRPPSADELRAMQRKVREGMEQGAVGVSSGLDYIPSRYADTAELAGVCEPIGAYGGVYVTHMRGYGPHNVIAAMDEVYEIGRRAGCAVHISHFNSIAAQVLPHIDAARARGVDVTYDLYPYLRGSTILGMLALPPWVQEGGIAATVERLRTPATRERLAEWFRAPWMPLEQIRLASVPLDKYRHFEGQSLGGAVTAVHGTLNPETLGAFVCDVLIACDMAVGCVSPHFAARTEDDVEALMTHPAMTAGSDGIYAGGRPHPRGTGCFAKYVGPYVRGGAWALEQAVAHCAAHNARRFGLKDRGFLLKGMAADLVVFDAATIADRSTYEDGKALATGVEHVLVNGKFVLKAGRRTKELPGRGLKRG